MIFGSKKLKILFITSEQAPFAKLGGLGEVIFSLPRALKRLGCDVRVMMPRYGTIDPNTNGLKLEHEHLLVPTGAEEEEKKQIICNVLRFDQTNDARSPVTTYFLENQEYFELRSNVYGYADDSIRFALLCRGTLEFLKISKGWVPNIIVSADWMGGFLPNFMKYDYKTDPIISKIASVFSIHNLAYQGTPISHKFTPELDKDDGNGPIPSFFGDRIKNLNPLRRGVIYADFINTVSKKYAEEITTEKYGEGMEKLFHERKNRLYGILNGLDYETNNPETDHALAQNFNIKSLAKRNENKLALQQRFSLPQNKDVFVIGIVSRLTKQKGFNLLNPVIEPFLQDSKAQLIITGTGDTEIMTYFQELEKKFPDQVRAYLQFYDTPHLIFAGTDVVLIPSMYEPSGLIQMEAMRYGAIPVARRTGGLADTIEDYSPQIHKGTGFLFDNFESSALLMTLTRSLTNWRHQEDWQNIQKSAMKKDFSWDKSAAEYIKMFKEVYKAKKKEISGNQKK
ncbi:MAG: glycogen/starch synthase [Candidatus Pacebacteria bacterium]|nr:glycogen/starch synthase [Candidatus Paceibacterota bacterium]